MIGDIETQHLPLVGKQIPLGPLGKLWNLDGCGVLFHEATKEVHLTTGSLPLQHGGGLNRLFVNCNERASGVAERVKGSSLDQRLDYPLRAGLGADPGQEVLEGAEALLFPRLDDALNYVLSNVSYRAETKPDVVPHRSKGPNRLIHIRRQNLDSHLPALI